PATNVHASRPPVVDAAVAAGLQNFSIPQKSAGKSKAPVAIGVGVAVLVAGIGVVVMKNKKPVVVDKPAIVTPEPIKAQPKPGDTAIEPQMKLPSVAKPAAKEDGPLRVAVLKFKNVGGDKDLTGLELGIGETAVSAMSTAGGDVTLIERSDIESDIGELDRAKDDHFD